MNTKFKSRLMAMRPEKPCTIAIAVATDANALRSVVLAHDLGFVNAILCGNESEIKNVAQTNDLDIDNFQIIDCADEASAITTAVALVRDDKANILMKGLTHTADILRAVLNRETGIRGDGILSHVAVLYSPSHDRQLFLTDMAMVMYPDLNTKLNLVNNAVILARHMGVDMPRVAPLCAVETLNPAMQATVDADYLRQMNERGEIKNCIVSGPVGFDIAVSKTAAMTKGITGPVAGNADILLFDNIEAGNNTVKAMVKFGDWIFGGVIMGARAPIIINSRSDDDTSKLYSIACACNMINK